jgi:uncharacterized delta-60 repeat protein
MKKFVLIFAPLFMLAITRTLAQAGLPDSTFGINGKAITIIDTPSTKNQAYSIAVQPDNKLVVAGWVGNTSTANFALARYSSEGILDLTFGNNGIVKSAIIGNGTTYNNAVIILPSGKIVVAGNAQDMTHTSNYDFAVLQYNENGVPDSTFGTDGETLTSINDLDYGTCVAAQSDGKIVVGGYSWNGTDDDFAIVRYYANGKVDRTFGKQGIVTTNILYRDYGESIAVQPDGKILLAGWAANTTNSLIEFAVARYNSDGSLDNTFGTNGIVTTAPGLYNNLGEALELQPDGKILIAGKCDMGTGSLMYTVVRFNTDGSMDNTFGGSGKAITQFGSLGGANAITLQADGKIIISGNSLVRYNTDGSIDSTFDTTGITKSAFDSYSIVVQRNGKIVVAGSTSFNSHNSFAMSRYLSALNYVTTGSINDPICAGTTISVPFTATGSFKPNNIFTIQLSDTDGSFANPAILGSIQKKIGDTMNVVIPSNTAHGIHYRIRTVSSNPSSAYIYDNGQDLVISPFPDAIVSLKNSTLSTDKFAEYQWMLNGAPIANAISKQYTFTQTGSYAVVVTNGSGCVDTSSAVNIEDTILTGTVSSPICAGSILTVPFKAKYFFTNGNTFTAQLSDANGDFSNPIIIGSVQDTVSDTIHAVIESSVPGGAGYRVRVVSNNPGITGDANTANITINPVPQPLITPSGDTLTTGNFSSYQWLRADTNIAGAIQEQYIATETGLYSVIVTDGNGCTGVSSQLQVGTPTGINYLSENSGLNIFPNPTTGKINIQFNRSLNSPIEMKIYDSYGKLVAQQTGDSNLHSFLFNLKSLPAGMYLLNVKSTEINASKIIVLTK